mmetsp:Transcript_4544/g.7953  ORF Transcript_4544/g.7953 Transcript_4544/m.7953 type:complete len:114 (-) Transcript_4544:144-485(-)
MFGLLSLVLLLLLVLCAERAIVLTYALLMSENYHWWWSSFISINVYAYAMIFYLRTIGVKQVQFHIVSTLTYVSYVCIISVGFGLMTGYVGFTASYIVAQKLYSSIRVDQCTT